MAIKVSVNGGIIIGTQEKLSAARRGVDIFYGLPYATADRFKRAKSCPPVVTGQSLNAQEPGPSMASPMVEGPVQESPLTASVFRPTGSTDKLPVVVYLHGGGFNFGSPLERDLASFLAFAAADIIVVAVMYRLGALGFSEEANLGLWDQRTAVEWVVRWISAFGGDEGDVTLMGVSAGAHSIGHHMLHPNTLPFRKAILESGSPTARSVLSASHPRVKAQLDSLHDWAKKPLREATTAESVHASLMVWAENMNALTWPFQPVIDNDIIPVPASTAWERYLSNPRQESVLLGFCSHEGTAFAPAGVNTDDQFRSFWTKLIPGFSSSDIAELEKLYPLSQYPLREEEAGRGIQFRRLHEAYAHYAYITPVIHTAHSLHAAGVKVFLYEYAALSGPFRAAQHGDQASIVAHDGVALQGKPGLTALADEMNTRWTKFIASRLTESEWPAFKSPFDGSGNGELLVFGNGNDEAAGGKDTGTPVKTRMLTPREREQCAFWWARMHLSQGMGN